MCMLGRKIETSLRTWDMIPRIRPPNRNQQVPEVERCRAQLDDDLGGSWGWDGFADFPDVVLVGVLSEK
jgi:hypothetical protein